VTTTLATRFVLFIVGCLLVAYGSRDVQSLGVGWLCAVLLVFVVDSLSDKMSGHEKKD